MLADPAGLFRCCIKAASESPELPIGAVLICPSCHARMVVDNTHTLVWQKES